MGYKLRILSTAEFDLESIYFYIAFVLGEEKNAFHIFKKLISSFDNLTYLPYRYKTFDKCKDINVHIMPVDNYRVFFQIKDDEHIVVVLRIVYKKRLLSEIINKTILN